MNQEGFRYPAMNTVADVEKVIGSAIDAAKTMKKKIQYAAIGCMILAGKEGNADDGVAFAKHAVDQANYLVLQLGNGIKGEGLVKYFVFMCGFKVSADKKDGFINVASEEWIRANLEKAKEVAWYQYAPASPFKGFDLEQKLGQLLREADNAVKIADGDDKVKAEKVHVDRDMLDTIHALVSGKPVTSEHALKLVTRLIPEETEERPNNDGASDVEQEQVANG